MIHATVAKCACCCVVAAVLQAAINKMDANIQECCCYIDYSGCYCAACFLAVCFFSDFVAVCCFLIGQGNRQTDKQ